MDSQIICPHCHRQFPLDEAVSHKLKQSILETVEVDTEQRIKAAQTQAKDQAKSEFEHEMTRQKEVNQRLMTEIEQNQRSLSQQKQQLEVEYQQKTAAIEESIRNKILDETRYKDKEKDKKLSDATDKIKQLETEVAKAKAGLEQNSGQIQGEVLELDIEEKLKYSFPHDDIAEVRKFHKGADVTQIVKNPVGVECGLILWEMKNAIYRKDWIDKFKQDMADAKASFGVLVSQQIPADMGEMHRATDNLWIVKPKLAVSLASALRSALLEIHKVSQHNNLKDAQMKQLYDYIVSPEFKYKVEGMVETYNKWQEDINKEKRWFTTKWNRQEKMINNLLTNTISIHSDFQGITNDALIELQATQLQDDKELDFQELDV